ncbi:hypothetical protein RVS70_12325 [Virgibacillus sp. M23]|uniref:hypothetical protein n=1 Tax=Virgibacillus sp. M23 TaxID=3079030 RepID=UPI002A91F37C|nr:hypothetical protein [Virgibacillus sp. M23]MDY7044986.1 hypothetical protein [Virgibacillus sp. M23]
MVIKVENENRIFSFIYDQSEFGNFVLAIRLIDEMKASYLLEAASIAREDYFGDNKQNWYLYKTTKSEFIKWFDNLHGPGTDIDNIEHQIISTSETTFEILSKYEPIVKVELK